MAAKKTKTRRKKTKRQRAPSPRARASVPRAIRKKKAVRKKKKKRATVRTKSTKVERKATRPTRRKVETNKDEIKDYFVTEERNWTKKLTAELKMVFLRSYARHGIISDGTVAAGITRRIYRRWRKEDEEFEGGCRDAEKMANDLMEREARRRGIDGFERPIIYKGEITGEYTDYSDALLTTLMRGNKPEKYRERHEHSGSIGRPMMLDEETKEEVVSSILSLIKSKPDPVRGA